jgi:hypothetical protein
MLLLLLLLVVVVVLLLLLLLATSEIHSTMPCGVCVFSQDKCLCGQGASNACKGTLFECQTLKCELECSDKERMKTRVVSGV